MTTPSSLVLFSIFIFGLIFLFRCVKQKKKGFLLLFFYISILFFISLYGYYLRIYFLSFFDLYFSSFLLYPIFIVSEGVVLSYSGGSNPGGGSSHMGGGSRDSGWTDFDLDVLAEPSSETEVEGTSVNSSIPREVGDEAGPSHQGSVVSNSSLEASLRHRLQRLEHDNSPFLLGKEKGEYWRELKLALDQATSQSEYNCLLDFESRDLQIREKRHDCLSLFQEVLSRHPSLAEEAPYNPKEVFMDFLDLRRDRLDRLELPVWERDRLELESLSAVRKTLAEEGPDSVRYIFFRD